MSKVKRKAKAITVLLPLALLVGGSLAQSPQAAAAPVPAVQAVPEVSAKVFTNSGTLKRGDSGREVAQAQFHTNAVFKKAGSSSRLKIDGGYGPTTERLMRSAQRIAGTTPDGQYGPNSVKAFDRYLSSGVSRSCPTAPVSKSKTTVVRGFRVHTCIADNVRNLVDDAASDGIDLTGWGWRDTEVQKRLRRQNCGPTRGFDAGDYTVSSSSCRPPTARPGSSMHERGLALDFANVNSRSNSKYKWLKANAAKYGLKNLPSEPWHWSTNGR